MRIAAFRHRVAPGMEPFIERQLRGLGPDLRLFTVEPSEMPGVDLWCLASHARVPRLATRGFQVTRRSRILARAIADFAPHVMLAHFAQDAWRIEHVSRQLEVPLVAAIHGSDALVADADAGSTLGLSARQLRRHWPDLAASSALFLPVSKHVRDRLRERGIPGDKLVQHYLGVAIPPAPARSDPTYDVGYVGRLQPNKGALGLLHALATYLEPAAGRGRKPRVLMVGDGDDRVAIERFARETIALDVDVIGSVPPEDVVSHMADCALMVCPSIELPSGMSEGLGLTSLEAQSVATPVVAFDTGGLPETIRAGETGVLVPSGDWRGLVAAVASLLDDPARRQTMGAAGRRWVEAAWDVTRQNSTLVRILEERFHD